MKHRACNKNDDPSVQLRKPKHGGKPNLRDEQNWDIIDFRFHKMAFLFRECLFSILNVIQRITWAGNKNMDRESRHSYSYSSLNTYTP